MTINTALCVALTALLLVAQHAFALPEEVPPDVFEAQPDGYLYADYPGIFDDVASVDIGRRIGVTVEAWIYLIDRPKDGFYGHPNVTGSSELSVEKELSIEMPQ